jgi:DNA-binding response OmpR family regulator
MQRTILIAEDNPFIALDLQDMFEEAGFSVLGPVAGVEEGHKLLSLYDPDIAMLDYNLGKETSIPLACRLQRKGIPFMFLSGFVEKIALGPKFQKLEIILKPINSEALVKRVQDKLAVGPTLA